MKAIQTSKHCNIICMYTAFTTTDGNPNKAFPDSMDVQNTGVACYQLSHTAMLHMIKSVFVLCGVVFLYLWGPKNQEPTCGVGRPLLGNQSAGPHNVNK